jgi:hypothetical protein
MNPADIRKLLGGYAAGTLTEEERRVLFEAALTDQNLFNELAREQALKELLEDPGARRQLLAALEEKPGLVDRLRAWLGRPVAWVAAGSLVAAALLVVIVVRRAQGPLAPEPVITAKLEAPSLPAAPPTPSRKAPPEVPSEIAARKAMRADAVSEGSNAPRSGLSETVPGGVVGGIIGGTGGSVRSQPAAGLPAAAPKPALEAPRSEARQMNSVSVFEAADATADKQLSAAMVPPPVPYRILRAGTDGEFVEAPAGTVFSAVDRVRVVFSPTGPGRLVATAVDRPKPLLDRAAKPGATVNLDLPAEVSDLRVSFTAQPERPGVAGIQPAVARPPVTFSIAIPREPAP